VIRGAFVYKAIIEILMGFVFNDQNVLSTRLLIAMTMKSIPTVVLIAEKYDIIDKAFLPLFLCELISVDKM
jgi:hypothetical protein